MNHHHPSLDRLHPIYQHYRYHDTLRNFGHYRRGVTPWTPHTHGGMTKCYLYTPEHELVAVGEAWCSMQDQFRYSLGRSIARGRAEKAVLEALTVEDGDAPWEGDGVHMRWANREVVKKLLWGGWGYEKG